MHKSRFTDSRNYMHCKSKHLSIDEKKLAMPPMSVRKPRAIRINNTPSNRPSGNILINLPGTWNQCPEALCSVASNSKFLPFSGSNMSDNTGPKLSKPMPNPIAEKAAKERGKDKPPTPLKHLLGKEYKVFHVTSFPSYTTRKSFQKLG